MRKFMNLVESMSTPINVKTMTEDDFDAKFTIVKNHMNDNAPFDGGMFETYGKELEYVRNFDPKFVWTIIEGDEHMVYASGFHTVNRLGYLITEEPHDGDIEVELEDLTEGHPTGRQQSQNDFSQPHTED